MHISPRVSPAHHLKLLVLAAAASLALTACSIPGFDAATGEPVSTGAPSDVATSDEADGASDGTPSTSDEARPGTTGAGTATLTLTGQFFTFSLATCIVSDDDVVVEGPGADDDSGEPAFLSVDLYRDGSFRAGGLRVDLGTDQPRQSMDNHLRAEVGGKDPSMVSVGDFGNSIVAEFYGSGGPAVGEGTLDFECA